LSRGVACQSLRPKQEPRSFWGCSVTCPGRRWMDYAPLDLG
jgi:hypothetical protein